MWEARPMSAEGLAPTIKALVLAACALYLFSLSK